MAEGSQSSKQQIASAAIQMFRQYGYAKTTVGDIAKACHMSPANIYRFYPSKDAIIEELALSLTQEKEKAVLEIAKKALTASERLEEFAVTVLWSNRTELVEDAHMYELVAICMEKQWPVIESHLTAIKRLIALMVQDGVTTGEFTVKNVEQAATVIFDCMCKFHHPQMLAQHLQHPLEQQVRSVVRLLCRGMRSKEPWGDWV
jgi:AcrR family transcriptional regulator